MEGIGWNELRTIDMSLPVMEDYKKDWKNWAYEVGEFIFYLCAMLGLLVIVAVIALIVAVWVGSATLELMVTYFPR